MLRPVQRKRKRPSLLAGLDEADIIGLDDHSDQPGPTQHATRQAVHGRPNDTLYNAKYHPMDEVTRPRRAEKLNGNCRNGTKDADTEGLDEHSDSALSDPPEDLTGDEASEEEDFEVREKYLRRRRSDGMPSRRSLRAAASTFVNYDQKVHPQDKWLAMAGACRKASKPKASAPHRAKKTKAKAKPVKKASKYPTFGHVYYAEGPDVFELVGGDHYWPNNRDFKFYETERPPDYEAIRLDLEARKRPSQNAGLTGMNEDNGAQAFCSSPPELGHDTSSDQPHYPTPTPLPGQGARADSNMATLDANKVQTVEAETGIDISSVHQGHQTETDARPPEYPGPPQGVTESKLGTHSIGCGEADDAAERIAFRDSIRRASQSPPAMSHGQVSTSSQSASRPGDADTTCSKPNLAVSEATASASPTSDQQTRSTRSGHRKSPQFQIHEDTAEHLTSHAAEVMSSLQNSELVECPKENMQASAQNDYTVTSANGSPLAFQTQHDGQFPAEEESLQMDIDNQLQSEMTSWLNSERAL